MGLDGVELVMECEDAFQIRIADADAAVTETVGQLQSLCIRLVEEQTQTTLSQERREAICQEVRVIVSEQLSVKIHRVIPEARFVQDLGMY